MVQTRNVAKRQKVEECTSCMELVLFNSDSLFKIASYLPADGLLNLALTCRRFGIAPTRSSEFGDYSLSLIEETARRVVQDIVTEDEMAALPCYPPTKNYRIHMYTITLEVTKTITIRPRDQPPHTKPLL